MPDRPSPSGSASSARPTASGGRSSDPVAVRPSTSPTGTPRVGRRQRARVTGTRRRSFFERYRSLLVGIGVVALVALVGAGLFSAATAPAYACSNAWVPDPTAAPTEGAAPQPGYVQPDMGDTHVGTGAAVTYTYCPPASGRHWNAQGRGPIAPRVYSADDVAQPQGWIHNLEHGGLVVLYRGDGPGGTAAGQEALRAFYDTYPPSPVCGFEAGTTVGPVFARFDDMTTPFAALVWGRVLPLDTLDQEAILAFDQAFGERTSSEDFCPEKRVSPSPSTSAGASASPAASPSASVAPSPSASSAPSPSASTPGGGSPSGSPAASASPAASPSAS